MASIPIVGKPVPAERYSWRGVESCERVIAAFLFLLTLPAFLGSAIMIRLLSGRSPLIAHKRVGWRGAVLWMLKLRTMWDDCHQRASGNCWIEFIDDEDGPAHKQASDTRVCHGFARFCRRHSIDELPQLWHVICGDMALIGPRPITKGEIRSHYGAAAEEVLRVKPGIAGLWQVSGRGRLSYEQRAQLDLEFVRNRSLPMYLSIILATLFEICTGADTW